MSLSRWRGRTVAAVLALLPVLAPPSGADAAVRWVTGYYAAYSEFPPVGMPPSQVDYTALTHVIHWPVVPLPNGTFDPDTYGLTAAQSAQLVTLAHAAGVKAILGFGGDVATVGNGWQGATSPASRAAFIAAMVNLMVTRGYDGIDINWEGLTPADEPQFTPFIQELRAALDAIAPRPLLTIVPTSGDDVPVSLVAPLQPLFDQINIQTYVMSGPYPGWVTWFNSPIFNGGFTFPDAPGQQVPSADNEVNRFVGGGIPAGNLGIGIQFDGAVWTGGTGTSTGGVTAPRQSWNEADPPPDMTFMRSAQVMATFTPAAGCTRSFDTVARVPWISCDTGADADDRFISFDDEQAIQEKAQYIAQKGLGGVFVFEVSGDFFPAAAGDARHPLLTALRNAFRPTGGAFPGGVFVATGRVTSAAGPAQIVTGPGPGRVAEVRVFDASGLQRVNYQVYPSGFQGGIRVAACDFNGDGRADIVSVAGPGGAPHVRIMQFDTAGSFVGDLASFFAYELGFTGGLFIACGDIDGDGMPEIILGVDAGGGPHVRILRYPSLTVVDEFFAYDAGFRGGIRVAAGNVDGSGRASLILGAGPGGGPHVRVLKYLGVPGSWQELVSVMVYDIGFRQGIFVAGGDVTGNGRAQVITSADAGGGPHVRVLGYDPAVPGGLAGVTEFMAYDTAFRGGVRVAVGNVDGAGAGEIITGAGPSGGPHVGLFTGTGTPLGGGFFAY